MKHKNKFLLSTTLLLSFSSFATQADIITYNFDSTISLVIGNSSITPLATVGDSISGSYSVDLSTPGNFNSSWDKSMHFNNAVTAFSMNLNGEAISGTFGDIDLNYVPAGGELPYQTSSYVVNSDLNSGATSTGAIPSTFRLDANLPGYMLSGMDANTVLQEDIPYTSAGFSLIFTNGGLIQGDINNLSVSAVPLPPAVWLFGSALLGLIGIGRKQKLKNIIAK